MSIDVISIGSYEENVYAQTEFPNITDVMRRIRSGNTAMCLIFITHFLKNFRKKGHQGHFSVIRIITLANAADAARPEKALSQIEKQIFEISESVRHIVTHRKAPSVRQEQEICKKDRQKTYYEKCFSESYGVFVPD